MKLFGLQILRAHDVPARVEPPISAASIDQRPGINGFSTGWRTLSGASSVPGLPPVTPDRAVRHGTVFACCNNIAGDLAKVPLKLYRRDDDGNEERVRDHAVARLLNGRAAPGLPGKLVRFAAVYAYALRGNGYVYAPRDAAGEVTRLDVVRQGTVSVLKDGLNRFYDFTDATGTRRRVPARSMAHMRYMAEDGWEGRSPLQVAAESVGIALAGQTAAARTAAGGSTKGQIKMADYYESEEDRQRNAERLKKSMTDPTNGGWVVTGPDEDVKTLDLSAADQELLASRKFDREMIAATYRMPPSKLQILEYGVKANGEQQAIDYLTDCLLHWSTLVEEQLAIALLTDGEIDQGYFLRHDFNALLQPTTKERYEAVSKAVGGPFMTPNEARKKEGMAPLDDGDRLNPAPNMTRDESAESKEENEA